MQVAARERIWLSSQGIEENSPNGRKDSASLEDVFGIPAQGYSSSRRRQSGWVGGPAALVTHSASVEYGQGHKPRPRLSVQQSEYARWASGAVPVTPPARRASSDLASVQFDATAPISGGLETGLSNRENVLDRKSDIGRGNLAGYKASLMSITVQISPRNPLGLMASELPPPSGPSSGAGSRNHKAPWGPLSTGLVPSPSDLEEPTVIRQWSGSMLADSACETEENYTSSDDEVADARRGEHRVRDLVDEFFTSGSCVTSPGTEDGIGSQKGGRKGVGFEDLMDNVSPEDRRATTAKHCYVPGNLSKGTQIGRDSKAIESSVRESCEITEEKTTKGILNNPVHSKTAGVSVIDDDFSKNKYVQPHPSSIYDSAHQLDMQDRRFQNQTITQSHWTSTKSLHKTTSTPSLVSGYQGRSTGNLGGEGAPRCFFQLPGIADVFHRMSNKLQLQRKEKKTSVAVGNAAKGEEARPPKQKLRYLKRHETIRNVIEDSLKHDRKRTPVLERKSRREPVIFQPIHDSVQDLDEARNMTPRQWASTSFDRQVVA